MKAKNAIIIRGPTASGKTELSLKLAEKYPIDIISVDSVMVYKGLDIGSAKPSQDILKKFPHHLIDICEPNDKYSAGRFIDDAHKKIKEIQSNDRIPLLTGGTMMYFKVLQEGLSELPSANQKIRKKIDIKAEEIGWPEMYAELEKIDPDAAKKIKPNDKQRIQRAIEVFMISGIPMSKLRQKTRIDNEFEYLNISLMPNDRESLYRDINRRFDSMIEEGLLDEVLKLIERKLVSFESHSMQSIGYREMIDHILGKMTLDDAIESAKISSRRYAKRQLTWLRSLDDKYKLDPLDKQNFKTIEGIINNHFEEKN